MNANGVIFIFQFLVFIGITLAKTYNIFHKAEWYDARKAWILFILLIFTYGTGLVVSLLEPEKLIHYSIMLLEGWLLPLHIIFMAIELFFYIGQTAAKPIESYKSNKV